MEPCPPGFNCDNGTCVRFSDPDADLTMPDADPAAPDADLTRPDADPAAPDAAPTIDATPSLDGGPGCGDGICGAGETTANCGADCSDCNFCTSGGLCSETCGASCFNCGGGCGLCTYDCTGVTPCDPICSGECVIDCAGGDGCAPRCGINNGCLLVCTGATNCGFGQCLGGETSCADNIIVCGRSCP